jgi:CheY-like chemotaxis protein
MIGNHIIYTEYNLFIVWFWQTWWFVTGIIIFLLGIAFIFYRIKAKTFKHQNALAVQSFEECKELLRYSKDNEQKAKEETEFSNRSKNLLLAKLSHEIRTPMNGIIGMASLLTETQLSSEQREYAETIGQCGENLMTVINDMLISDVLDYSNAGVERMEIEYKDFYLPNVIEEVLEAFVDKVNQAKLELVYYIDQNVPSQIVGDPLRLRQVLMNILENAVKYTTSGEIFIGVHLLKTIDRNQIELGFEVRDTGTGLPDNAIELLSKDISSIDVKLNSDGLELIICKKIIGLMGGYLKVENKAGGGALFKFTIRTRVSLQPFRANAHSDSILQEKRILIIDDNSTNQTILKKLLEQRKLIITMADSGKQALEILSKNRDFDLILADMEMPEMNGIELMNRLRNQNLKIPAILLNTKGDERYKEYPGLFKSILVKPIKQQILYKSISNEFYQPEKISTEQQNVKHKLTNDFAKKYPLRILIAEDNITNQQIALMILKKIGYEPDLAKNGQEALEMVSEGNYDVILMDVQMPIMDGLEATRMMRLCLNEQPIIIAMTANAMQGDRQECLQAGMDDYISKPIKPDELAKMLEKWAIKVKDKQ